MKIAVVVLVTVLASLVLLIRTGAEGTYPLRDINGTLHGSLTDAETELTLLMFLGTYCPISQLYAPEIIRICDDYRSQGAACFLVFPEPGQTTARLKEHLTDFGYKSPAILDSDHAFVKKAGASVTPEAAVFSRTGTLVYRGRINDLYAAIGRPRFEARQHDLRDALDTLASGETVETPWANAVGCFIEPLR